MGYPYRRKRQPEGPVQADALRGDRRGLHRHRGRDPEGPAGGFYRVGPTWKRPTKQGTNRAADAWTGWSRRSCSRTAAPTSATAGSARRSTCWRSSTARACSSGRDGELARLARLRLRRRRARPVQRAASPQGTNNVNVFPFAGEMLASGEQGGPPIALDPITLETKGVVPWSRSSPRGSHEPAAYGDCAFTAHPKWDPETGDAVRLGLPRRRTRT